jgi:hypothetical protein
VQIVTAKSTEKAQAHVDDGDAQPPSNRKFVDLVMAIDPIAHVEEYRKFLREIKSQCAYKLIHIPLGISSTFCGTRV